MNRPHSMPSPDKITPEQFERMGIDREKFEKIKAAMKIREKNAPEVGGKAPNFELKRLSQDGQLTEERVGLTDLLGRPIALVFGSYT